MATGDTPQISTSSYTTTSVPLAAMAMGNLLGDNFAAQKMYFQNLAPEPQRNPPKAETKKETKMGRRIVQVFIADTDENVPLEKSILFTGEQKLTDATDQELFFEIDMKGILQKHNAYRTTLVNKKVKERTENLEPVKIRDLKMVVVNVATFA